MTIGNIQSTYTFAFSTPYIDTEEKEIAAKLIAYGEAPTGDKTTDRAKLHRIEAEKTKQESTVSANKFLTISTAEQENIQTKKKENRKLAGIGAEAMANYNKAFIQNNKISANKS